MKKQDFYEMVESALEGLPPDLAELLDNVAIVVEDWPEYSTPLAPNENNVLYGLYEGVPLTERSAGYYGFLPTRSRSSGALWSETSRKTSWRSR